MLWHQEHRICVILCDLSLLEGLVLKSLKSEEEAPLPPEAEKDTSEVYVVKGLDFEAC